MNLLYVPHSDALSPLSRSAYADLVVMVNAHVLTDVLKDFETISSAKINWAKSETVLVGDWVGGSCHYLED